MEYIVVLEVCKYVPLVAPELTAVDFVEKLHEDKCIEEQRKVN